MTPGVLVLEDGRVFRGVSFGADGEAAGEIVFNTSMTGYQEVLTDPSYHGQIVAMTYPLIGNYGVNPDDEESDRAQVRGFAVREYCPRPSNWRATGSLGDYLIEHGIVALSEIDTRALTRHIRTAGAMKAVIAAGDRDADELAAKARQWPGLVGRDMVSKVTCAEPYTWEKPCPWRPPDGGARFRVVACDYGIKYNILRYLVSCGCAVEVVPAATTAADVLARNPDGVFLSNGPGDPQGAAYAAAEIRKLLGTVPVFGICMGHQLLCLALGGDTYKLKFGHRGANHPVQELATKKVEITTQNHGFCVDTDALPDDEVAVTHVNLNDNTVEGIRHRTLPAFSVQYHPEASAGPHDAEYLFGRFTEMMEQHAQAD